MSCSPAPLAAVPAFRKWPRQSGLVTWTTHWIGSLARFIRAVQRWERRHSEDVMELRPATPADLALLRRWDAQPHVLAANPNDDWAWETELGHSPDWREQLIAELSGRPAGFIQIIDPALE